MRVFILEDDPMRIRLFREAAIGLDATFAESCPEAIAKYAPPYDVLMLDHDLGGEVFVESEQENTGAGFCRWLPVVENGARVIVHSYNPVGAANMAALLREKGYEPMLSPFGPTALKLLQAATDRAQAATR